MSAHKKVNLAPNGRFGCTAELVSPIFLNNLPDMRYLEADVGVARPSHSTDVIRGFRETGLRLHRSTRGPFHEGAFLVRTTPELPSGTCLCEFGDVSATT